MRELIVLLIVASSGCIDSNFDLPDNCPAGAGSCNCAADEVCVSGEMFNGVIAACMKRCASDRDCAVGMRCLAPVGSQPFINLGSSAVMACVSPTMPRACDGILAGDCSAPPPACLDDHTLGVPVHQASNHLCGWAPLPCVNGCVHADADGGDAPDGGTDEAHCR